MLLELLLATSLGVFLITALVGVHRQMISSHSDSEGYFEAVETATAVERMLHDTLHLSGDYACSEANDFANIVNNGENEYWLDLFNRPRQVYAAESDEARAIRAPGTTAGARAPASDVLVALSSYPPVAVTGHNAVSGYFELARDDAFKRGSFAVVCNQDVAVLFQVSNVSNAGKRISYNSGSVAPGNCASVFDITRACGTTNSYVFADGTLAAVLNPVVLFVGIDQSRMHRSLYRERLTIRSGSIASASMRREEIAEGIDLLRAVSSATGALEIGIVLAGRRADTAAPYTINRLWIKMRV